MEAFLLRMAHGAPILQHRNGGRSRGGKGAKGKVSPLIQKSRWKSPGGAQLPVDQLLRICKRFYVALILSYLVQVIEISITVIFCLVYLHLEVITLLVP